MKVLTLKPSLCLYFNSEYSECNLQNEIVRFTELILFTTYTVFYVILMILKPIKYIHVTGNNMITNKPVNKLRSFQGITPKLGANIYIDESAVILGDITLADDVSIWPLVAARGDVNTMSIGARTNIQDGTVLHVTRKSEHNPEGNPLVIGEDVTVGHKCMLHGCTLGDRILVGMGAIIMDGAVIESDVFISAGALVPPNKTLTSGYLYVGNPVKKVRPLKDSESTFLKQSAINYVELKNDYLSET